MKNLMIGVLITTLVITLFVLSVENQKVAQLSQDVEAHKLAISYANQAIHTFADPVFASN